MGFLYLDSYYLILCVPALIFAMICQGLVKSTYRKYSGIRNSRGITGAEAARKVLMYYGIQNVNIVQINGNLTDNYDPSDNCIHLSAGVFNSTSIAAIGIACHEAGHAAQHAENYFPIKVRTAIIPLTKFGSSAGLILALLGYFLQFEPLISIGLILYFFIVLFQLVTLPVEFNASHRALKVINDVGLLGQNEISGARKVLSAAAMTYVAALIVAFSQFLRLFLRFNRRR